MMKRNRNRFLALLLTLAMLLPLWPGTVFAVGSYGRTVGKNVLVYKEASPDYGAWFYAEQGTPGMVLIKQAGQGGTYYKVQMFDPYAVTPTIVVGFILESQFKLMTDVEATAFEAAGGLSSGSASAIAAQSVSSGQPAITAQPAATAYAQTNAAAQGNTYVSTTGVITRSGVNFRSGPSKRDSVHMQLDRGTEVEVLSIPAATDPDPWYQVRYSNIIGYIQGPFLQVTGAVPANNPYAAATAIPAATAVPVQAAPAVTAAPAANSQPAQAAPAVTYAKLLLSSANLRNKPNGDTKTQWTGIGSTLPVAGPATMYDGYAWYPVTMSGAIYYVRGDYVQLTSTPGASAASAPSAAVVTAAPQAAAGASAAAAAQTVPGTLGYVKTTKGGVNLRLQPNGGTISQIARNVVLPYIASPVTESNYLWYYVQADNLKGYLRGDCVALCAADGTLLPAQTAAVIPATAAPAQTAVAAITQQPGAQPTLAPVNAAYIRTTASNVNLRVSPGGGSTEAIKKNVVLPLVGQPVVSGKYTWYPVRSTTGRTGWLRGDCVVLTDANGYDLPASATVIPITTPIAGTVTPAPTAVNIAYGYLQVTKSKVNVRKTPAGGTVSQVDKGTVWPIAGAAATASGYTWYPVRISNQIVYLRGDCVQVMSDTQTAAYLAGQKIPVETATPVPQTTASVLAVQATANTVNIRRSASQDAQSLAQVSAGTVLLYTATTTAGGKLWYNVTYGSTRGWVLGTSVKTLTDAEYSAALAAAPAATATESSAASGNLAYAGYVKTIKGGVNVRKTAEGLSVGTLKRGIVLTYTATTVKKKYTWYKVNTTYGVGWVRSDCVEPCMADGSALTAEAAAANSNLPAGQTVNTVIMEASYTVLKLGSTGSAVSRLITALRQQGYYNGTSTSSYTTDVQDAVTAFQRAKGLSADGIAGSNTQHALYGTVPKGSASNTSDMSMVIYPAEKIDWFKGGIQEMWPRGANAKVYDVKTGIVWWAHRWAGAYHADIEPLTASDTARLCQIYGVSKASEIASKNLWQRRPCLITIGNHTYACSLYGVPHNYGAGDISNNNMNGQVCLHFTNSKTHTSKKVDSYHRSAIEYAWQNAPNGHK